MDADVVIIGAGAAGLMSAISAGSRGLSVLVLEANERAGLKILISGGGRCNFTNLNVSAADYESGNEHFCKSALKQFSQNDFISWVQEDGIEYYEKTLGQLFCTTSSKEILNLLLKRADDCGVKIACEQKVISVKNENDEFVVTTLQSTFRSKNLIIASGGLSFSNLGATGIGYEIAKSFGHEVTSLSPALDGFVFSDDQKSHWEALAGVSAEAQVKVGKKTFTENILFTHVGLSGPAILKASLYWHDGDAVNVNFLPNLHFDDHLADMRKKSPKKRVQSILKEYLPEKLAVTLCERSGCLDLDLGNLSNERVQFLKNNVQDFQFVPKSTVGYHKAEVTRGGVSTQELSSKTMESKLMPGLYFKLSVGPGQFCHEGFDKFAAAR